jgi:hypothetical protein
MGGDGFAGQILGVESIFTVDPVLLFVGPPDWIVTLFSPYSLTLRAFAFKLLD